MFFIVTGYPTPWKKSRTYGDFYGGRERLKLSDNIFKRAHSLQRPGPDDVLPILMEDNPSRDFFFPLSGAEVLEGLRALPEDDCEGITHVWLKRVKKSDFIDGSQPLAWFICGSGVRLITLFAWPTDLTLHYGAKRPSNRSINEAKRYGATVEKNGKNWVCRWELEAAREFFLKGILYHEVGHHIDWCFRHMSAANGRKAEDFADQYAMAKTVVATHVISKIDEKSDL